MTNNTTVTSALIQIKLLYRRFIGIIKIKREETEETKTKNDADYALIGFLVVYFLSIIIIEWPNTVDLKRWLFDVIFFPFLWFTINWILLWTEDKLREPELFTSQLSHTLRLFIYILISYWIIYILNYIIFLIFVDYIYYISNYIVLFVLNVFLLKTAFKQKELLTCVINAMFSISIPVLGFIQFMVI